MEEKKQQICESKDDLLLFIADPEIEVISVQQALGQYVVSYKTKTKHDTGKNGV